MCRCIFLARLFPSSPCKIQTTEKCQTTSPPEAESINAWQIYGILCPYHRIHPKQDLDPPTPSACEKRSKNDITTLSFCPTRGGQTEEGQTGQLLSCMEQRLELHRM